MSIIDYLVFGIYMAGILGVGFYHFRRNESGEDYFVGNRKVSPNAVGLSIVATDVGGGFSVGLGGVGFLMGLSGSWLLFTGFLGAWLSAVFIIPRIKGPDLSEKMLTYPDFLRFKYNDNVAVIAAVISAIGYLLFAGGQILAGATLASETALRTVPFNIDPFQFSLYIMGAIIVLYTVLGGIKAVIYTDFVQWILLLSALLFLAAPLALKEIGGWSAFVAALPDGHFNIFSIKPVTFINWMLTITPIWLVGMTLYQRMYAVKGEKEAKRAWFIAGVFEWPIMAFVGVFLGMCARALYPELSASQAESGLPMLINDVLPIGITGIVIAAYFSAIMSTADSCIVASSGNIVNDFLDRHLIKGMSKKKMIRMSQLVTLLLGVVAISFAGRFQTVLDAIMYAYGFLVSGLFFPTLGAYFWKGSTSKGAASGMVTGGLVTMLLIVFTSDLPLGLDPVVFGLAASGLVFYFVSKITSK